MRKRRNVPEEPVAPDADREWDPTISVPKLSRSKKFPFTVAQWLRIQQLLQPPSDYAPPHGFDPPQQTLYAIVEFEFDSISEGDNSDPYRHRKRILKRLSDLAKESHDYLLHLHEDIQNELEEEDITSL